MKRFFAACTLAALAGCNQTPSNTGAVTTAPAEAAKPVSFQTTPLDVPAASVKEQDVAVLAGANWTKKNCALTLSGVPDSQAEVPSASSGKTRFAGFFIDPSDQPAGDFEVVLKGEGKNFAFPAKTGWDRTDVADYFKLPQLASSGYDLNADLSGVPAGKYKVDYMVERSGGKFFCESGKTMVVSPRQSTGASLSPTSPPVDQPASKSAADAPAAKPAGGEPGAKP